MTHTLRVRPAYSQIMILDPSAKVEVPLWEKGVPFVASDTCILYGCYPDIDGETEITVGTSNQVKDSGHSLIFDGVVRTPSRKIALETVEGDSLLVITTNGTVTPIRIWANKRWAPDVVMVGVD